MPRIAFLCLMLLLYTIVPAQQLSIVRDSIMQVYMTNGYANKHFIPKGTIDNSDARQGKWKDYETRMGSSFFIKKDESNEQFSNYLFYGEGEFKDGKRAGDWDIYIIEDKTLKKILSQKLRYVDGQPEGYFENYYPNGKVARTGNFVHGKIQDSSTVYYPDGKTFAKRFYKDDEKDGQQRYFFKSGKLKYIVVYAMGKKDGEALMYYEDGTIKESSLYKADSLNGSYKYYYPDGKLWTERIYDYGRLLNVTKLYDKNGHELYKGTLKDGDGTINFYTEEGKIYSTQTYANGLKIKEEDK